MGNKSKLKPDLAIYEQSHVSVVDIQIINNQFPLNTTHSNKIDRPLLDSLRPEPVTISSLTLNWRGSIATDSINDLVSTRLFP